MVKSAKASPSAKVTANGHLLASAVRTMPVCDMFDREQADS